MNGIKFPKKYGDQAREAWLLDGGVLPAKLGFSLVELGRRFRYEGEVWEIAGIHRPAGRFRLVCRHVITGELCRFSNTLVRACAPEQGSTD